MPGRLGVDNVVFRYGWPAAANAGAATTELSAIRGGALIMSSVFQVNTGTDTLFTRAQIDAIGAGAGGKLVLGYMSIGEVLNAVDQASRFGNTLFAPASSDASHVRYWGDSAASPVNATALAAYKAWIVDLSGNGFEGAFLDVMDGYFKPEVLAALPGANQAEKVIFATRALMMIVAELNDYIATDPAFASNRDFRLVLSNPFLIGNHHFPVAGISNPSPDLALIRRIQDAADGVVSEGYNFNNLADPGVRQTLDTLNDSRFAFGDATRIAIGYLPNSTGTFVDGSAATLAAQDYLINAALERWTAYVVPYANAGMTFLTTELYLNRISDGPDALIADVAGSTIDGGAGGDLIVGRAGADRLSGGAGSDRLRGGDGADILIGGIGADTLTGGTGPDVFRYLVTSDSDRTSANAFSGVDLITDFQTGTDQIDLTALGVSEISIGRLNGGHSVMYATTPGGRLEIYSENGSLNAHDIAYTGSFGVYIFGSDGIDTIVGSARADPLVGNAGDDVITGGGGADAIAGGTGRDVFRYVSRGDSNQATGFDNLYDFVTGVDRIDLQPIGATSISILRSDNGSSFVYAETAGGGFLTTAAGRAINATDIIYSGGFGIYMVGSGAADVLVGTSLADPLYGGGGNDTITGGGGADAMFGEGGIDTFVYVAASDSTQAASDGIFGFVSGTDKLDLRQVRTGATDTYGIAYLAGGSFLFVDLGGNGTQDMVIGLAGTTLVAGDILWTAGAIGEEPRVKDAGPEVLPVEDEDALFDGDPMTDLSPTTGRVMLDLEGERGFHGQDWYL